MVSHQEKKEKALTNLVATLDKIAQDLDKLPTVFAREQEFAQQFDLYDPHTKDELFRSTVSSLRTLKMNISIAKLTRTNYSSLSLLQPFGTNLAHKTKYATTIHINCLPQENGRWVATASMMGLYRETLGYGETKEKAVAEAVKAIAPIFEANS
jgi:hypothetical protein